MGFFRQVTTAPLTILVVALCTPVVLGTQSEETAPGILKNVGLDQRLNAQVSPELQFVDETGSPVRLSQYFGQRPVILTLVYYECPMLCTLILNGLVKSLRTMNFEMGKEFEVVSVSINPRETPALASSKKTRYVDDYGRAGAAKGWHFLTGKQDQIEALAETVGFRYVYDETSGQYAHASGIMVLTPQGRIARYYYGVEYPPRDLRLGLVEASANRIGSPVDQILLFCFHYDPNSGKYTVAILNFLRVAGVVTVLAIGSLLFVLLRRDREDRSRRAQVHP